MDSTSMNLGKHAMVSPPEFAVTYNSFASPALTNTRYNSSEPSASSHLLSDKMGTSPRALGPPKNMAALLSPPPSPYEPALQGPSTSTSTPQTYTSQPVDPPIYYSSPSSPAVLPEAPLFGEAEQFNDIVSKAIDASTNHGSRLKPTKEEYFVFVSAAFQLCRKNPQQFIQRERRYIAGVPTQWSSMSKISKKIPGVSNRRIVAAPRSGAVTSTPAKIQHRIVRTPKIRPASAGFDAFARDANVLNGPSSVSPRVRATATREDTDFEAIPDMCPPLDTLTNPKCLKADWKGTPLDLSKDPHRDLLHPAELHLAATLRLSCASYLTSKRRIFREKIERARMGMEFRKTDSQKACKIDVNKASKLWAAYDRVGWFDRKFIAPYL